MRIGLNAHFIGQPTTGSGQYLRGLLWGLSQVAPEDEFALLCDGSSPLPTGLPAPFPSYALRSPWRQGDLRKVWHELVAVPGAGGKLRLHLLHYPYFAGPLLASIPAVITIHDLIPMILPEYRRSLLVRLYTAVVAVAARRAVAIIADSEHTKRDVLRVLGVAPERVHVVYLAPDRELRPQDRSQAMAEIQRKFPLQEFILYLGGFDPRKNTLTLLNAFALLVKMLGWPGQLVMAGLGAGLASCKALAEQLGLSDRVCFLGPVADKEKALLYSAAAAFVYPSLYEGFGLPPLEALACGAPVVCSDAASLPEVVGDAAILVDAHEPEALAQALAAVLTDRAINEGLREQGPKWAARFTWEETARQTLAVYRRCSS